MSIQQTRSRLPVETIMSRTMTTIRRWITPAMLCVAWLGAAWCGGGDWPTYRHDLKRSGVTTEEVKLPLSLQWHYSPSAALRQAWSEADRRVVEGKELRDRLSFDDAIQVAIVDGRVFFGSPIDHHVYCLDASTGKVVWRFATEGPIRLAPTVTKQRVYVGSDDGFVYCLDTAKGQLVWKRRLGPADESILARGEMI